jgi:hypothetical protein
MGISRGYRPIHRHPTPAMALMVASLVVGAAGAVATIVVMADPSPNSPSSILAMAPQPVPPRPALAARNGLNAATAVGAPQEPGSGGVCPETLALPTSTDPGLAGMVSRSCGGHIAIVTYAIAGPANSDTRASAPNGDYLASHPASTVHYIVSYPDPSGPPGWSSLPPPTVNDTSVKITNLQLANGLSARVTTPIGAVGMYRVEWINAGSYYQLLSAHGYTSQGTTGVPQSTLLAMANSLP